jgi:hypothetical protein
MSNGPGSVAPNRETMGGGAGALAAVLQYHGEQMNAQEIADAIYLPGFRGSLNLDLLVFARSRGYEAWAGEGSAGKLMDFGLAEQTAGSRVDLLTDQEVHVLASDLEAVQIAGDDIRWDTTTVLLLLILVVLIAD